MVERVVELCRELGAAEGREVLTAALARSACIRLRARLRPGVSEEDCGPVFPLAAALLTLEYLEAFTGEDRVASFTAGEVSIRREEAKKLGEQAMELLSPWLADGGFVCKGVAG